MQNRDSLIARYSSCQTFVLDYLLTEDPKALYKSLSCIILQGARKELCGEHHNPLPRTSDTHFNRTPQMHTGIKHTSTNIRSKSVTWMNTECGPACPLILRSSWQTVHEPGSSGTEPAEGWAHFNTSSTPGSSSLLAPPTPHLTPECPRHSRSTSPGALCPP